MKKRGVWCYETKEYFKSLTLAGKKYNTSGICGVIDNPNSTVANLHWCSSLDIFDNIEIKYKITAIYCYETKEYFKSIRDAENKYNLSAASAINSAINQAHKTAAGYHWCTSLDKFDGIELTYKNGVIIYCYETKEKFLSLTAASTTYKINADVISNALDNPNKAAGGYHWCTSLDIFNGVELTFYISGAPVYCYESRKRFDSVKDAAVYYNIINNGISIARDKPERTAGGFHWCTDLSIFDSVDFTSYECGISNKEKEIVEFIKSIYSGEVIENSRNIISPLELDIYLPELKLAIEFNGNYWHSEEYLIINYHINKTNLCIAKDIQLLHIFEHQWKEKQEIVKSIIRNKLGLNTEKIYARKCEIREVTSKESNIFLDANHMQGSSNSKINLGLYTNNKLVSLMTFNKPRFNKKYEYELVRFCNKLNTSVIGGASKLLKYFERNYQPESLISYANLQWSLGGVYEQLGFTLSHISRPNYWWVRGGVVLTRYQCQKHKLSNLLNIFDSSLSEVENMQANGYSRLHDCGNLVLHKQYRD